MASFALGSLHSRAFFTHRTAPSNTVAYGVTTSMDYVMDKSLPGQVIISMEYAMDKLLSIWTMLWTSHYFHRLRCGQVTISMEYAMDRNSKRLGAVQDLSQVHLYIYIYLIDGSYHQFHVDLDWTETSSSFHLVPVLWLVRRPRAPPERCRTVIALR